jgi:hypothetical protein
MTSTNTLSPRDTGEIQRPRLPEDTTTDLTFRTHGPLLRRPDATGEIQMPRFLDDSPVQPLFPLERVINPDVDDIDPAVVLPEYNGRHRARLTWREQLQRAIAAAVHAYRTRNQGGDR